MADVSHSDHLLNGAVTLEYTTAERSGALKLTVKQGENIVHSDVVDAVTEQGGYGQTERGRFKNDLVEKAEGIEGLDTDDIETAIKEWFNSFVDDAEDAELELRGDIAQEIIAGTETPVEIHGRKDNGTTYNVTLTFRGRRNTIEFDADTMVPGSGPGALQSALAHQFYEPVEVPKEDWEEIREYWADNSQVTQITKTDGRDAKADRLIEYLSDSLNPVDSFDSLGNGVANALVDTDYSRTPDSETFDGDAVVWIQNRHLDDELESVTTLDDKGNMIERLRDRDEIVDKWRTRKVTEGSNRNTLWAFHPVALGVDADAYDGRGVEP